MFSKLLVGICGLFFSSLAMSQSQADEWLLGLPRDQILEIDCKDYSSGGLSLITLLGTPKVFFKQTRGLLPKYFDDRRDGSKVIVVHNFTNAHPDLVKLLIEIMERGTMTLSDGERFFLNDTTVFLSADGRRNFHAPRPDNNVTRQIQAWMAKQLQNDREQGSPSLDCDIALNQKPK